MGDSLKITLRYRRLSSARISKNCLSKDLLSDKMADYKPLPHENFELNPLSEKVLKKPWFIHCTYSKFEKRPHR